MASVSTTPEIRNEPVLSYAPGTAERAAVKAELERLSAEIVEIPLWIGGDRVTTGQTTEVVMPHEHARVVARAHKGTGEHAERAIEAALGARHEWASLAWEQRAAVFLKAADLLAGPWRARMNAATMLGQSKTVYQAEIDAACELADFWRFNVHYLRALLAEQPASAAGIWNRLEYRPLEGFIFAVTPFNFTAIAANLPTAPALMGNTVVWKPAPTQLRSAQVTMELLEAAGLPPGVINMVHGDPAAIGNAALTSSALGGLHFTGSVATFQHLFGEIGRNLPRYQQFPRIVGETGGKDFVFLHPSAEIASAAVAIVRGAFEYQGQKCSAASRVYVPRSLWPELEKRIVAMTEQMTVGDVRDFTHFMGAVIDGRSFQKISGYIELARSDSECKILTGGTCDGSKGWFIRPTIVETSNPNHRLMREEIFGPVLTVWVYEDQRVAEALEFCDGSTPYGLTGAIFARDRSAISRLSARLSASAGNFYINDKPTGAVVGQQPFGGSRLSGTNDKAGSLWNLLRWTSPRTIKETFAPPTDWRYPFMEAK